MTGNGSSAVRVYAPASVSNVGPGFDVFGFALTAPGDVVTASFGEPVAPSDKGTARLTVELRGPTGVVAALPRDVERNTAAVAASAVLAIAAAKGSGQVTDRAIHLVVDKRMPLASGLGSSAASAVAGAVAVDRLLGLGLDRGDLLRAALAGERAGCGAAHADNVAPSLYGGFVLVRGAGAAGGLVAMQPATGRQGGEPPLSGTAAVLQGLPEVDVVPLPVPAGLTCAVVRPHLAVETKAARAMLGDRVSLAAATAQWGNAAGLVAALFSGDLALLARCLVDHVAEPCRSVLVPGFGAARDAALAAGALGAGLSGSGPSLFAIAADETRARAAAAAMVKAFAGKGIAADDWVGPVGARGARQLSEGEKP